MTALIEILRNLTHKTALAAGFSAAIALSAPMMASAQDDGGVMQPEHGHGHGRGHRRGRGMHRFERMSAELGLTDAQQEQMRALFQGVRQQRQAIREQSPEQRGPAMRALHQRMRNQIRNILTPAQQAQAQAMRAQHREARMNHRIDRMSEHLSLTPAQERQIRAIFDGARDERQQLAESQLAPEARREAFRSLRERTQTAVRQVLTPAQQAQMDQLRAQHPRGHRGFGRGR